MKIVAIISSPRPNGNSATLAREALKGAAAAGAEVEEIYLPKYKIDHCQGCLKCVATGKCHIGDDLDAIWIKLLLADGIIFSSPTYGMAPNAMMKKFFERIGTYAVYTSCFGGKYVIGFSTTGFAGAKKVAGSLTELISGGIFSRGYVSGILGVRTGWDNIDKFPQKLSKAYNLGAKMANDIKYLRKYPCQHLFSRFFRTTILKPIFTKNIMSHKESEMKAVYQSLTTRGLLHG